MYFTSEDIVRSADFITLGRRGEDKSEFLWAGSGVAVRLRCRELYADIFADWSVSTPWAAVLIDGAPVARFPLQKGRARYALLTGMDVGVEHEVALVRDTQPIDGEDALTFRLEGLMADEAELLEPALRPVIEFIGDSLTTGEGLTGPKPAEEWKTVYLAASLTYAQTAVRLLDARGEWVSLSGWGVYTDWEGNTAHTLGSVYDSVCPLIKRGRMSYDFAEHPVDAVVINLGTNDAGALSKLREEDRPARLADIHKAAVALLWQIRKQRPAAPILWIYGMCGDVLGATLADAVREAAQELSGPPIEYLPLPACPEEELGSRQHPGPVNHFHTAQLAAEALRRMMTAP